MSCPCSFRALRGVAVATVALHLLLSSAHALVLGGNLPAQESPPADDPGWNNVIAVNGSSGVYLGDQWIITAAHVGASGVTIGGNSFSVQPGTIVRLKHIDGASPTDLLMFRLSAAPALPALSVVSDPLADGSQVTMVGLGRRRGAPVGYTFEWVPTASDPIFVGYSWDTNVKGWGRNRTNSIVDVTYDDSTVRLYETVFDEGPEAEADEAQGALHDSGGALFAKVGGSWKLAGVMLQASFFEGQPFSCAIFGNATYSAELASYRAQIEGLRPLTTPYAIWTFKNFGATPPDAAADADIDGVPNLLEYAFGTDPTVANPGSAPVAEVGSFGETKSLTVTYQRDTAISDATVVVEVSTDLVNWSSGDGVTAQVGSQPLGGTLERVTVRDLADSAAYSRRFIRVRATR